MARSPLVVPVPRAPRLHAREPTTWELAGDVKHRRASPQARDGGLRGATISRQQKDMVGYNCVLSKARSWRVGIRNIDSHQHPTWSVVTWKSIFARPKSDTFYLRKRRSVACN